MAKRNSYSSYRGRKSSLKWMLAMILIGVIAVCLGYFFWGDHGLSWSIFPRFDHEELAVEEIVPEVELVIDTPEPVVDTVQVGGLLLDVDATTWPAQDSTDFDKLALTMKDGNGTLYYQSSNADLVAGATSEYVAQNADYVTALLGQSVPVSAFVSVLQDPLYASYYVTASALMSGTGYGYKDGDGKVWLDPAKEDAVAWIVAVIDELTAMGFDEIILTDFHYPQTGDLENIRYAADDPQQALHDLLEIIYTHTQAAGVSLGMEMSAGALVSGSVPYEDWTEYVDMFYVTTNDLPTAESLVGAEAVTVMAEQIPPSGNYLLVP
ncbi:putative glycoside hydrolase [Bengtsoniella intestinalis]|uniref:putative glycoside hydrolase n=1 Tax=Bengtsoniella intestinalis TaxID=3073143 RepID=UPI00391F587D